MEKSIELEKENSRLRERVLWLERQLQKLEKENVDLKEKVKRLDSQLGANSSAEAAQRTRPAST